MSTPPAVTPQLAPKPGTPRDGASSARLSEGRRRRLEEIQKREALKDQLIDGFKAKFKSAQVGKIGQEVDSFLKGSARITEANLKRLEKRIEHGTREKEADASTVMSEISEYSMAPSLMSKQSQGSQNSKAAKALDGYASSSNPFKEYDWSKLDEYASFLHEQDAHRQKQQFGIMQEKLRLDLDRQVADTRLKKQKTKENDMKYHLTQISELDAWKELEESKAQDIRNKNEKEKVERDVLLKTLQDNRQAEKLKKQKEEQSLVDKIAKEMEVEKQRLATKKQQEKEKMKKIYEDNQLDNVVKEEARKAEQRADVEAMQEYNRILDAQDKARADVEFARQEKQRLLMEKMVGSIANAMALKADEDSRRADKQKKEADERAIQYEQNKADKLKQMRYDTQDFLFKQIDEKNKIAAEEMEAKEQRGKVLLQDAKDHMDAEQKKLQDRRERNKEHQKELTAQIHAKRQIKKYAMSESEIAMNRQLLELVESTLSVKGKGTSQSSACDGE